MTEVKHTPLPWRTYETDAMLPGFSAIEDSADGYSVSFCSMRYDNAAFIVHACNTYYQVREIITAKENKIEDLETLRDDLLDMVERMSAFLANLAHQGSIEGPRWAMVNQAHDVLAKAKGE